MINEIPLDKNEIIQIIEHRLGKLSNFDLACIVNQYSYSWVRYNVNTDDFTWTGGERPSYLAKLVGIDRIETERVDN